MYETMPTLVAHILAGWQDCVGYHRAYYDVLSNCTLTEKDRGLSPPSRDAGPMSTIDILAHFLLATKAVTLVLIVLCVVTSFHVENVAKFFPSGMKHLLRDECTTTTISPVELEQ